MCNVLEKRGIFYFFGFVNGVIVNLYIRLLVDLRV